MCSTRSCRAPTRSRSAAAVEANSLLIDDAPFRVAVSSLSLINVASVAANQAHSCTAAQKCGHHPHKSAGRRWQAGVQ